MKYWLMPLMSPCGTFITYKKMYYQPLVFPYSRNVK